MKCLYRNAAFILISFSFIIRIQYPVVINVYSFTEIQRNRPRRCDVLALQNFAGVRQGLIIYYNDYFECTMFDIKGQVRRFS
jgi:hypothetical protein